MITKWCSFLLLGLAFLLVTSVIGCAPSYTQEDLDAAREADYSEGYAAGKAEGYTEGYDAGYDKGYNTGLAQSKLTEKELIKLPLAPTEDELKVHFIDVGQGDSILVDLGETEILIDGGGKSPGVVEYLGDYVDGALEVMVATHPHADHIGGLVAVLDAFDVEEIWHNGDTSTSQTYAEFVAAVQAEGVEVYEARRGDIIEVGELVFNVLHPVNLDDTVNNNSIVLSLSYGEIDFLFMGDTEKEAETSMLAARVVPDVEVLKVGHHGSRTASSRQFLQVAKPELAIYMAGYLSPEPSTLPEEQRDKLRAELHTLLNRVITDSKRIKEITGRLLMTG